jgi:hypothetical protein
MKASAGSRDFSDLRKYQPGKHRGLLLVRLANLSRRALIERVSTLFAIERCGRLTGMFCCCYRTEDPDAATLMAKYRNGVLRVELPKARASRQRSIPITVR